MKDDWDLESAAGINGSADRSLESYDDYDASSSKLVILRTVTIAFCSCVFVLGVFANALVIHAVLRHLKVPRNPTYLYLLNMAVASELFLLCIPLRVWTLISNDYRWIFGDLLCKMYVAVYFAYPFANGVFLAILSADTCVTVCLPNHVQARRKLRSALVSKSACAVARIAAVSYGTWFFAHAAQIRIGGGECWCNFSWEDYRQWVVYLFVLSFVVPASVVLTCCSLTACRWRQLRTDDAPIRRSPVKLVLALSIAHVTIWLPHWIAELMADENIVSTRVIWWRVAWDFLIDLQPVIFSVLCPALDDDGFGRVFRELCRCCCKKNTRERDDEVEMRCQMEENGGGEAKEKRGMSNYRPLLR